MPFRKMSGCTSPRLGTEPRLGENERVSWVRFSSSTLSLWICTGSGVVVPLSGRKMVLKPLPLNAPVNADSGPRLGSNETCVLGRVKLDTSPNLKPLGCTRTDSRLGSFIGTSTCQAKPDRARPRALAGLDMYVKSFTRTPLASHSRCPAGE